MTTDVDAFQPTMDDRVMEQASSLSIEEFGKLSPKDRDMILFAMLRLSLGNVQFLTDKAIELETKARELGSPEGIQALTEKFMGGFSLKGLGF